MSPKTSPIAASAAHLTETATLRLFFCLNDGFWLIPADCTRREQAPQPAGALAAGGSWRGGETSRNVRFEPPAEASNGWPWNYNENTLPWSAQALTDVAGRLKR